MFRDRQCFVNLCQLKIYQTFVFCEHFLFFRWNARKCAIFLWPAALDEYIKSSANLFHIVFVLFIAATLETITTTTGTITIIATPKATAFSIITKEISLYSRRKTHELPSKIFLVVPHPSVGLSHSISLPWRPTVLKRRVYRIRVLPLPFM